MAADKRHIDRRTFSLGVLGALAACNKSDKSKADTYGFPGGLTTFAPATHASVATGNFWTEWRAHFVAPEGRVVDTGNGDISHSEGQSYGMLLALQANDRETFARIADWTEANLARSDMALHGWRWEPQSRSVTDTNNATDGDIVIAWALSLAGTRWNEPRWSARAAEIRGAIRRYCVINRFERQLLLPGVVGFVTGQQVTLNPSYFVWPALDQFAQVDGQAVWGDVIHDAEDILRLSRFGAHNLPSDWVMMTGKRALAPAPDKPPRFGYDAIRVALWGAQGNRSALTQPIASWWRSCLAQHRPIPAWVNVVTGEEANYAVSNGGAAIVGRLLGTASPTQLSDDYFAASQQLLALA